MNISFAVPLASNAQLHIGKPNELDTFILVITYDRLEITESNVQTNY